MRNSVFYKIFLFLVAVGVIPLLVASFLEYKNIQDLSENVSNLSGVNNEVVSQIDYIIADTKILILLISFFALILIILETTLLSRKITTPLYKLTEAAEKIRKGKFDVRVNIESGDEFENLGNTFNKMAKDLKNSNEALTKALEESKEAQHVAEKERNKTKATLNSLVDGLLVVRSNNEVDTINPPAEKILNLNKKQVIGKNLRKIKKSPKLKELLKVLDSKEEQKRELVLEDGGESVYEIYVVPIVSKREESGTMIVLHDITREKRIEHLKNEFISIAAHQLRTPLSAIKWSLDFLEEELHEELGDDYEGDIEEYLEKTMESNDRMISLVNDLLNISRIEEGRFIYQTQKVSVINFTREVVKDLKTKAKQKKVELKITKKPDKGCNIKVDEEKMELALQNLIDNAIKYSYEDGKVFIRIKKEKSNNKNFVQIEVEDNGMGISEKDQMKLFTKFSRGQNAMKSETDGSGLGLFIVKNIINSHGGEVWFESKLHKGSTFYIKLPCVK